MYSKVFSGKKRLFLNYNKLLFVVTYIIFLLLSDKLKKILEFVSYQIKFILFNITDILELTISWGSWKQCT